MSTWGVRSGSGTPVTTLRGLARALQTDPATAAKSLLDDAAMFAAAPPQLQREVKAAAKPGGGTPPPISNGSYVSWSGGKGRVDLIVSTGKVPGIDGDVEGTDKTPAARVVVWENGKSTGRKIGMSVAKLKRIPPIRPGKSKAGDPAALVTALAAHESKCEELALPEYARVSGRAVKAVYDRGIAAYPGPDATVLSPEEWALGRVEHFTTAAAGDVARRQAGNDTDLLHHAHPYAETKGLWSEARHPRDGHGRFIEIGREVRSIDGDLSGVIRGITRQGQLTVEDHNGRSHTVDPKSIAQDGVSNGAITHESQLPSNLSLAHTDAVGLHGEVTSDHEVVVNSRHDYGGTMYSITPDPKKPGYVAHRVDDAFSKPVPVASGRTHAEVLRDVSRHADKYAERAIRDFRKPAKKADGVVLERADVDAQIQALFEGID